MKVERALGLMPAAIHERGVGVAGLVQAQPFRVAGLAPAMVRVAVQQLGIEGLLVGDTEDERTCIGTVVFDQEVDQQPVQDARHWHRATRPPGLGLYWTLLRVP